MTKDNAERLLQKYAGYKAELENKVDRHVEEFNRIMSKESREKQWLLMNRLFAAMRLDLEQLVAVTKNHAEFVTMVDDLEDPATELAEFASTVTDTLE